MYTNTIKSTNIKRALPILLVATVMALAGCNAKESQAAASEITPPTQVASAPAAVHHAPAPCYSCGVIDSIRPVKDEDKNSHLGLVVGAIIGGVAGNQIGKGTSATAAGAVVGGYAGNEIEKNNKKEVVKHYIVSARMQDGRYEQAKVNSSDGLFVGQKVRLENGNIILR